jgi:hypothetical protein
VVGSLSVLKPGRRTIDCKSLPASPRVPVLGSSVSRFVHHCFTVFDALPPKLESPPYTALIELVPTVRLIHRLRQRSRTADKTGAAAARRLDRCPQSTRKESANLCYRDCFSTPTICSTPSRFFFISKTSVQILPKTNIPPGSEIPGRSCPRVPRGYPRSMAALRAIRRHPLPRASFSTDWSRARASVFFPDFASISARAKLASS